MPIVNNPAKHSGPAIAVGVAAGPDGIDRGSRVALIQHALVEALKPSSDWTKLRSFLQLAMLWGFAPTASEMTR